MLHPVAQGWGQRPGSARAQPCCGTKHLAWKSRVILFSSQFSHAWRLEQRAEVPPGSPGLAVPALAVPWSTSIGR